jgi:hypothetical protein
MAATLLMVEAATSSEMLANSTPASCHKVPSSILGPKTSYIKNFLFPESAQENSGAAICIKATTVSFQILPNLSLNGYLSIILTGYSVINKTNNTRHHDTTLHLFIQ